MADEFCKMQTNGEASVLSMEQGTVLIVGAGHAGFQVAVSLRQHGYAGRIGLINDEAHLPYQRPPLSKAYLKGSGGPDSLMFRPDKFYRDQNVDLIGERAVAIDRAARRLLCASGTSLEYAHLVLATGARNRMLDIPNANLADVRYLRTLDESDTLRKRMASAKHVVVVGAGFIGLEFAATARAKGLEVDVIELGARVMARAVTAEISAVTARAITRAPSSITSTSRPLARAVAANSRPMNPAPTTTTCLAKAMRWRNVSLSSRVRR